MSLSSKEVSGLNGVCDYPTTLARLITQIALHVFPDEMAHFADSALRFALLTANFLNSSQNIVTKGTTMTSIQLNALM